MDYGLTALAKLRDHIQQERERQGPLSDVSSWGLLYCPKTPKQPGTVSCGACVLIMIELMATRGVEAFYLLNEQCEYRRAGGPLPEGATEVFRAEVQWTTQRRNGGFQERGAVDDALH